MIALVASPAGPWRHGSHVLWTQWILGFDVTYPNIRSGGINPDIPKILFAQMDKTKKYLDRMG